MTIPEGWVLAPREATEAMTKAATPTLKYSVTAYDEAGYGDDRSRDFPADQEAEATAYAASLEPRFGAHVHRVTRLLPADEIYAAMLASAPPAPGGFSSSRDHAPSAGSALEKS